MKTAIVVSISPTSFEALAFSRDVPRAFQLIAECGFDGVEIAVRDPAFVSAAQIQELADRHHLSIAAIGTGQAYLAEGLSLSCADRKTRCAAVHRMKKHLELGRALQAAVIVGLIRGTVNDPREIPAALHRLHLSLAELAGYAEKISAPGLLLEPINRYETRLINSVAEAVDILSALPSPKLKILADTFHMNIEERNLHDSLLLAGGHLGHLHFADSNRRAPGQGHLDFKPVLSALNAVNYRGFLSAEILPWPDSESAARLTAGFFKKAGRRF